MRRIDSVLNETFKSMFGPVAEVPPMKAAAEAATPEEVIDMAAKKNGKDAILNTLMEALALNAEHMRQAVEGLDEGEEMVQRRWVVIRYTTTYKDGTVVTRNRKVIPVQIFQSKEGNLSVVGYDDYREDYRTFRLDRISAAALDREASMFCRKYSDKVLVFANSPKTYWKKPRYLKSDNKLDNIKAGGFGLYPVAEILAPELNA